MKIHTSDVKSQARNDTALLVSDFSASVMLPHDSSETKPRLLLPDYRLLSLEDVAQRRAHERAIKEKLGAIFLQFQKIFRDDGFKPLLLELAAIRDRADSISRGDSFASHFASFAKAEAGRLLLTTWRSMVTTLVEESPNFNYSSLDLVPNPRTYEYVFHATPLDPHSGKRTSDATELTLEPLLESSSYELPTFVDSSSYPISLPDNMKRIARIFSQRARQNQLANSLSPCHCWIFVVPFFRVIEYAQASVNSFWENFGGRPGGCLIGLLQEDGGDTSSLQRSCIRLSWLLHKGAFVESDAHAQEHRYRRDLLHKLGHAVRTPMTSAGLELDNLVDTLSKDNSNITDSVRSLAAKTRSRFHAALAATRCIEFFVQLGTNDPAARERIVKSIRSGYTRIGQVIASLADEEFLSSNKTPLQSCLPSLSDRIIVEGARDAWWLVLYLLLKNASEASPKGSKIELYFSYSDLWQRAELRIVNRSACPLSGTRLGNMNAALTGAVNRLSPNEDKTTGSLGLGVVTIGQILQAWGLRSCSYTGTSTIDAAATEGHTFDLITFELRDIPTSLR